MHQLEPQMLHTRQVDHIGSHKFCTTHKAYRESTRSILVFQLSARARDRHCLPVSLTCEPPSEPPPSPSPPTPIPVREILSYRIRDGRVVRVRFRS